MPPTAKTAQTAKNSKNDAARRRPSLASRRVFMRRLAENSTVAGVLIVGSLAVGIVGYHLTAGLGWIDSFLNAAMIMSGMGPVDPLSGAAAKLFAGVYAIYSGFALIATAGLLFAPVAHRLFHRFHLEDSSDEE